MGGHSKEQSRRAAEVAARAPELSVVIPVYNEAGNIETLLEEIRAALAERLAYEVIVVDDASDDDSLARLRALRPHLPQLRIVRHRTRCGQSSALSTGIGRARAPWIATLDGDGQNDPADIPHLLEVVAEADTSDLQLVCGHRWQRRDTWVRRMSSRIANGIRRRLLHDETPDTGCGLKLIRREAFLALPAFDHMHRFLPALVQRGGGRVVSVQVSHRPRRHGTSKYGIRNRLWVGIVDLLGVMWLRRRHQPVSSEEID